MKINDKEIEVFTYTKKDKVKIRKISAPVNFYPKDNQRISGVTVTSFGTVMIFIRPKKVIK